MSARTALVRSRIGDPAATAQAEGAALENAAIDRLARASVGISVHRLRKTYGDFVALDDVSLEVRAGEFLTLLGPSGSGKTTLLNIVAGFVRPDRGKIIVGGEDFTLKPVNHRGLGMVFQNYALFPHMTVGENIAFPLKVRRMGKAEIAERVRRALRLVQLEALMDRNVGALSGGQRQRVALARAIVFSPQIVLMDEPLSALDKNLREQMQVEIRHLHEKIGATTIYVTHDQREALTMSDRIAVMNHGRIEQCDAPRVVYDAPRSAFVAGFIGETTLIPVTPRAGGAALPDGTVLRTACPLPPAGEWFLVLRAERVLLPDECGADTNRIPVMFRDVIYQGDSLLILAELPSGHVVTARRPLRSGDGRELPSAGTRTVIGLAPESTVIVRG